jgi:hypothetical protein
MGPAHLTWINLPKVGNSPSYWALEMPVATFGSNPRFLADFSRNLRSD